MDEASAMGQLAALYNWTNELDLAYTTARDALRLMDGASSRLPALSYVRATLGDVMIKRGETNAGAALIEKAVAVQREIYANEGPKLAKGLGSLARAREFQGRYDDALSIFTEAIALLERSVGRDHYEVGYQRTSLGRIYFRTKKWNKAISELALAIKILEASLPATHAYVTSAQYWYGEALIGSRRFTDAIPVLSATLENQKNASPHWLTSRTESALGLAYYASGYAARARIHLCNAYAKLEHDKNAQVEAKGLARIRAETAGMGSCRI